MKKRLDVLLVEQGLAPTRARAQAMIMAGEVVVAGKVLPKSGQLVASDVALQIKDLPKYVSRGGDKIASVVDKLSLNFQNQIILDVGSSTGGFTDFALQSGAKKVYAVDVGTGQLAYKLRQDPRVAVMERTDIRDVKSLPELPDLSVIDASFISLVRILDAVANLIKPSAQILALVKPQFEAGKKIADRSKGVIKDERIRLEILERFREAIQPDFEILGEADSGIPGASGNLERFFLLSRRVYN